MLNAATEKTILAGIIPLSISVAQATSKKDAFGRCFILHTEQMDSKGRRVRKRAGGTFSRRPGPPASRANPLRRYPAGL